MRAMILTCEGSEQEANFWKRIIHEADVKFIGAAFVPNRPNNRTRVQWIFEQLAFLGFSNAFRLGIQEIRTLIINRVKPLFTDNNRPLLTSEILRQASIVLKYFPNANDSNIIKWIQSLCPDLIMSVQPQIIGKTILDIPGIGVLNKHASLLPAYRSIIPLFWALFNGEKEVGVTVHFMSSRVDAGPIVAQSRIAVKPEESLYELSKRCWKIAPEVVLEALKRVEQEKKPIFDKTITTTKTQPYYPFPTRKDRLEFQRRGYRIL